MQINDADKYEPIMVQLSKEKTPIAFNNKVKCLMSSGLSEKEAEEMASEPIELELYYEVGFGLFAVESQAIEGGELHSPYSDDKLSF